MILHVYHCNEVHITDKARSVGRNRPGSLRRWPARRGEADIHFQPPTDGFADRDMGAALAALSDADPLDAESPLKIDWEALAALLNCDADAARCHIIAARELGLLPTVGVKHPHERWMEKSHNKGCLVVMACVERSDHSRSPLSVADAVQEAIVEVVTRIVGDAHWLSPVYIVPNVHLAPREPAATDTSHTLELLVAARNAVEEAGFFTQLGSFGYSKMMKLVINAHPVGYVIRVV